MTVARCPYCQQTIVGQIVAGDGGWTCPSCKRVVGTLVERGSGQTIVEHGAGSGAGQTIVEGRPTPFRPEVVREAESAASGANGDAKPPPAGDEGGTIAVGDRPLRTGPGGTDPLIGEVLGGCRILEVLGRGAMGTVYKATQLSLDRTVALKVIREELCTDDDLLSRFQREAKMVGRFSTPHVVQIHDVGRDKRVHFIVMEFVSGGSLLAHVNELPGRRLPPDVAIRYMIEAAEGLLEAERLGIIHRDIKPENLLLDHAGRVKVADFGISRSVTMSIELTATQAVIGTPLYMSPEQCRAEKVDHRSDMYSLGATFCHMLAGKRPLHEESVQELLRKKTTMEFLSPRRLAQDGSIPESLSRVIERMTALDRADRYPTFKEVVEDLRRVERGELIEPFQRKAARARLRRRLVKATVTAAVLAVVGYGAYRGYEWWQERHPGPETDLGTRVPAGLTAAQLDQEANELRAKLVDPRLLNADFIVVERGKIRSAVEGPDSGAALRLAKLCDDAQRLVDYRESSERLRPAPFTPPFSELEERWKKLRENGDAALPDASGKEVREYVRGDLERREKSDRTKAIAALTKSLDDLERRVKDGVSAADARSATRELDDVVAGRGALERLFPGESGAIVAAAPDERCSNLREAIAKLEATAAAPTPEAPLTAAAAKKKLGELTQEFQTSGPSHLMEEDARAMRSRLQEGSDEWAQVGSFLEFVTRGNDVLLQLDALRNQQPPAIRPPFEELATFRERCSGAIHLDAVDPDWYRSYFEKEPTRRLAPFKVGAQDAFTNLVGEWRKSSEAISSGGGDAAAFEKLHQQVGDSRKNLKAAFGDQSKFATDVLGDAEFEKVARDFDRLSALRVRVAEGSRLLDEAARALEGVTSCAAWRERGPAQITPKIEAARKVLDEVRAADARAVDAATQAKLSDVEGRAGRWSNLVHRLDEAIRHVGGDHDLAAARGELDGIGASDDPTVKQAKLAVERLTAAFDALIKDLDLARARSGFEEAQRALAEAAPTLTYAADCRARVAELEKVVGSGMARVPAGRVRISSTVRFSKTDQPIDVAAYWLDSCETSIGQFQQFLKEVASDKTTVARLLPTLPGLSGESVDAAMEKLATPPAPPAHLAGVKRPDPRLPIEKVSYAQAVVCLARQEKSLPTLEEWWLAAKGSLSQRAEHRRFPWNDGSSARLESALGTSQVCARMSRPMQVDQGGDVLGFDTIKVHHLSGNVEEWTQAVPSGQDGKSGHLESRVIGGSYDDEDEARFSGDQPRYADVTAEQDLSTGFRGVVRPREFFAAKGLAPKGP